MGKDKYAEKAGKNSTPSGGGKDPFATRNDDAPAAVATEAAPVAETKEEKKEDKPKGEAKGRAHIVSYLAAAKSRHKELPQALIEQMEKAKTKGEAQRLLKNHLQKQEKIAAMENIIFGKEKG